MKIQRFFKRNVGHLEFQGHKIVLWDRWYWLVQFLLVKIPFKFYYSKFSIHQWENVPTGKPIIFAITHRNAFMDSLAFVNTKDIQVFQLARGDAFSSKFMKKLFYFFHMLPIWRERDRAGNRNISNDPTFAACYELLFKNQMLGIYPEGDCINENSVRPLKKGICRIAFGAMEAYNWEPDIQIVPVGVNYSDAEKFRKWQMINFGKPISVADYKEKYFQNEVSATTELKDAIEWGMREVALHIPHSHYMADIEKISDMISRHNILERKQLLDPISKFNEQQPLIKKIENIRHDSHEMFSDLVLQLHKYQKLLQHFRFRENTFDPSRQHWIVIVLMLFYFIVMLPVYVFGIIVNYLPYKLIEKVIEKNVKQAIFYSSLKYAVGIILFPVWYIILFFLVRIETGSLISAVFFLIAFPVTGIIAFHYWQDIKKWWRVIRFKKWNNSSDNLFHQLLDLRKSIITSVNNYTN